MKLTLLIFLFIGLPLHGQVFDKNTVYLDDANHQISEEEFKRITQSQRKLIAFNDSLHVVKIVENRLKGGEVTNPSFIYDLIAKSYPDLHVEVDKPLIVIFYPGKDKCNATGSATKSEYKQWHRDLENKTQELAQVKPVYLFKNTSGLETYRSVLNWKKDPENIIESTFFELHYPCSSYVILMPTGKFIVYYGEFSKEKLLDSLSTLSQN
ncbi:MAG: hypothetical protein CFE24_10155 [Flavobacterium sp. BFFFF2]|nr:MAG: hypothetical protein CFE24_10155 [Flavobacterium sp. BFFFF2]